MSAPNAKEKRQRRRVIYSEEFKDMLERLEEEDYADRSGSLFGTKNRLCLDKVKALERHFEEENKLQPDRKFRIAEEVGLEPRQVAIWFQNRRARWKTKQLEKEYDQLRASYDALKHDYGSLEQEKIALLNQLKDLKAKIEARNSEGHATNLIPAHKQSTQVSIESTYMNASLLVSSESSSSTTFDPFPTVSSYMLNEYELHKAYQDQQMRMEDMGVPNNGMSYNFFSVDQAPSLQWHHSTTDPFM